MTTNVKYTEAIARTTASENLKNRKDLLLRSLQKIMLHLKYVH